MKGSVDKIDEAGGLDFIRECRAEGKTQRETALMLGYRNPKVIYNYLKKHNIKWSDLPCECEQKNINQLIYDHGGLSYIIRMKNKGYTLKDIAEDLGYKSSVPLTEYFKRNNIIWKNLGFNKTSSKNRVIDNDKLIIREVTGLLDAGYELHEILEIVDISHPYLNHVFRRNNLSLKKYTYKEHETPIFRLINYYGGVDYLVGKEIQELANLFGYSYNYTKTEVRRYLKDSNYQVRWDKIIEV